ncbi:MAG: PAS domain S-box protein [Gammaproteobacteria bacterium]|jgi:diguanylate cyclase (GGDEF)-like protein/PAS domain S-box-containing protein|nr:PAS domain S-box protein [Gammaproteobacteria bacterium]
MTVKSLDEYRTYRRSVVGARILVVDDDSTVRMIVQQFLKNAGFTVTVATSGEEAFQCLEKKVFDLMLLDILMPDVTGFDVLEKIRQKYSKLELLVIMVTMKEESADMLKAFSLGANDYVVKPIDFTVLRARIEMHLSLQRAETELRNTRNVLEQRVEERTAELLATNKALVVEINERKNVENSLKAAERKASLVLQSAGEGIYGLDIEGNTTFINPAGEKMLGWEVDDLLGKPMHDLLHHTRADGSPYPREECPIYKAVKDGKVHHVNEEIFWCKDGSSFPVEYTSTPITEDGELVGAVVVFKNITERKLAEQALLFTQTSVDQAGDVIYWLGPDGKFMYVNDTACEMYGYSREELLSMSVPDIDIEYPKEVWQKHWQDVEHCGTMTFVTQPRKKNGESFNAEITETFVTLGDKEYLCGVLRDVTERKQMEDKLRKSHILYNQAEQMGKLGHWEWDHINERMAHCSKEFAQLYEMTVDEALEFFSSWDNELSVAHPEDRLFYEQHVLGSEEEQKNVDIEYRVITPSGKLRYVHLRSEFVRDNDGKIITSFGAEQDITERKLAEEELRKSHTLYGQAAKMGKLGHWEWDVVNEKLMACSEQYAEIFEMTVEEAISPSSENFDDDIKEYIHNEDRERYKQVTELAYERKEAWDVEFRIITANGRELFVRELGEPVFDESGEVIKTFGTFQDITERKQAEEEIRHLAYHDELTGLPTLRLGKDRLSNAIALARRNKNSIAVLFMDLDGFKNINDTLGHKAGDYVLTKVAERLKQIVRETDTVARIGGDEFIIVLTQLMEDTAVVKMTEKIVEILTRPMEFDGQEVIIGSSIGIALYPDHGDSPEELIEKADKAMYSVKHRSMNNYSIAK